MTIIPPTHLVDRAGVSWIAYLVTTQLGWLFREQETSDIGIDAQIEVVEEGDIPSGRSRRGTGHLLAVQIKSGMSQFAAPADRGWWFYCDAAHVAYWRNYSLPVVLMLFDPESELVFWQHVNGETLIPAGKSYKVLVPHDQRLDTSCSGELGAPARRRAAGRAVIPNPSRGSSVRQADYELASAIDLLAVAMGKTLDEAEPQDFTLAFASRLRALYRRVGAPALDLLTAKTGYKTAQISSYLSGTTRPSRGRVVAIVQALIECAHEKEIKVPGHLMDVRAWERMWRVANRPGMQKMVKNKARKGASPL
ncbi:DUF4365 domain-containing protein [Streptomyces chattanoogensis]|uniref:DUF4365 domain-containing protein n=1 Tax=Streptomyces chattanoogensis TaxID=66876 RepID=UPI00367908CB